MKYSYQGKQTEKTVKVIGTFLPVSFKASREVAKAIRGKKVNTAITFLERVVEKQDAVPYTRFNKDTPHRRGNMTAGRYPVKVSKEIINLLNSLKKNADDIGVDSENLQIVHAVAQDGPNISKPGRTKGKRKITHFEIIAKEAKKKSKPKKKEDPKKAEEDPKEKVVEKKPVEEKKEESKPAKAEVKPEVEDSKETKTPVEPKEEKAKPKEEAK